MNKIVCGDCIKTLARQPENSAQLVVADPPYFNVLLNEDWDTRWKSSGEYLEWTAQWMRAAMRVLRPGGLLYCFGQTGKREHAFLHLMSQATQQYAFHDLIVWDRCVGYSVRRDSFTPAHEMILVLRKDGAKPVFDKNAVREPYDAKQIAAYARDKRYKDRAARMEHLQAGKYATNIWRIPSLKGTSNEKAGHPSQKPLALIERIVLSSSAAGELVIDPFSGSGTTAVVAQKHGRGWLGIEISKEYCALSRKRLAAEAKKKITTLQENQHGQMQ